MPSSTSFRDRTLGQLLSFGPVTARAMFGGYGLYLDGLMFGLIADDTLYFKVDDGNRDDYVKVGAGPFTYEGKRRPVEMSYYQIPEAVMKNPTTMAKWAERAHQAAKRSRAKNPPRRNRGSAHPMPRRRS
ncbi:MAG: TfoX/Sxy family protein [Proteobacteria bacterium]|nr:TfoX/Sxy family protein [Pseudomonadota bacterium]MDA1325168.1 TfoX/Sxy family protein [Pseudomonadota bacterium]